VAESENLRESPINAGGLSLADYAAAMAHVVHFDGAEKGRVLGKLGLTPEVWTLAEEHWLQRILDDIDDEEAPVTTAFSGSFTEVKAWLKENQPKIEELEPLVEPSSSARAFAPVDETAIAMHRVDETALPFATPIGELPQPVDLASLPKPDAGETQAFASLTDADIRAAMPFGASDEATDAALRETFTMAHYASFRAELAVHSDSAQVLARYQLTDDSARERVDGAWARRFAAHPEEEAQFNEMLLTYKQWLETEKG